ncbi:PAS domain-containing protein [bacterium]|nr:PAS domain-containing protein [bacterium]MBU1993266.1 PAS domain-containing protein [bacterium]
MSEFLGQNQSSGLPEGHPVKVYLDENQLIRELISKINRINIEEEKEAFTELFEKLCLVEKHFARKENQLFPYLEKYGWTSPSQNMWAFHDQIRDEIKAARGAIKSNNILSISQNLQQVFRSLEHILQVEEQRLLPRAFNMLSKDDWEEMRAGDEEIGWMFDEAPPAFPALSEQNYIHPSQDTKRRQLPFSLENRIKLDEGFMLPEQINWLLKFMPVDITYVDENDIVIFYNRGDNRVFPRSAGIIGREVKFCHPPKSVDQVLMILREFKAGRRDEAEFWITFKGKFIHIRYFAIRDDAGTYKGVIEVSQDVTHIRGLEGQQRLLDWE